MKKNSIEKLQERLETLHVIQDARLACNADDLDIREEIAEVEEEIKELQDETNVNRENNIKSERSSIEEDIKIALDKFSDNKDIDSAILIVEKFILGNYILRGGRKNIVKDSLRYILSDYKRVLKDNEFLRKDIEGWKKYCEEIEEERIEMSNKNCELEFDVEELQKENEELHKEIDQMKSLDIYKLVEDWETGQLIPIQKIKDKIEGLKAQYKTALEKNSTEAFILKCQITILQELIEEREEK